MGPAPEPGRWGRGVGDSTGLFLKLTEEADFGQRNIALRRYFTLPTATVERLSSIDTQAPEFRSDWRLR